MWIKLDDSLKRVSQDHHHELIGLESILSSIFHGQHALALSSALGDQLLSLPLSRQSVAAIKNSLKKSAEQLSAWRQALFKLSITMDGRLVNKISESVWNLPISLIAEKGMPKSLILAENLTDARLYKHSAEHYRIISKSAHRLSAQLLSGGGGDTPKVLQHELLQTDFFIFCITDSDKPHPAAGASPTSKKCKENIAKSNWIGYHFAINEREAENILPKTLVEDSLGRPELREILIKFQSLQSHNYTDAEWEYLDLKEGTLYSKCISAIDFWKRASDAAGKRGAIRAGCLRDGSCQLQSEKCDCFVAPGMGDKFLEHAAEYLDRQTPHAAALRVKTSSNSQSWLQIGESVSSWTAATEKIRA